jgi:hypothetical protein
MSQADVHLPQVSDKGRRRLKLGETVQKGPWWLPSLLTFLGLSAFIVYSTWAALQGVNYWFAGGGAHYLSPMYSPVLFDSWKIAPAVSGHAWFGPWPTWLPKAIILPLTPAFLVLWAPAGFRFTCYYYRGAYYKAFWGDPPACAVGEPGFRGKKYRGERKLPLILQNVHRYFFYIAALFIVLLSYDAVISYIFTTKDGGRTFGIAVGSLVLTINPILLGGYTFGCHSYRHLIGGRKDRLSELGARKKAYDCVSCLNRNHMKWAWASLFWVGFTDFYVRMCAAGVFTDFRIV